MDKNILVAYASKNGATMEIAQKIGEVLRNSGLTVDVNAVNGKTTVHSYQAIILGSAVYMGQWRKEAVAFLQDNEQLLADLPVWLFSSGPTGEGEPVQMLDGWRFPDAIQAVVDHIKPQDIAVFHGFINPGKINFIEKGIVKGIKKPMGDFRDWAAIADWSNRIAAVLIDGHEPA